MSHVRSGQRNPLLDWIGEFGTPGGVKNLRALAEALRDTANSWIRATEPFCKSRGLIPPTNEEPLRNLLAMATIARDRCDDALAACRKRTDAEAAAAVHLAELALRPFEYLAVYLEGMAAERSRKARQTAIKSHQTSRCKWDVSGVRAAFEAERLNDKPKWANDERFVMEVQRHWQGLPRTRELLKRCTEWRRAYRIQHRSPETLSAADYVSLLTHPC